MKYVIEEIYDRKARSLHCYDNLFSFWGSIHDSVSGSGKQYIQVDGMWSEDREQEARHHHSLSRSRDQLGMSRSSSFMFLDNTNFSWEQMTDSSKSQ